MGYLLSLDVGVTTGWAIINYDGTVERHGVAAEEKVREILSNILWGYEIENAVVENPIIMRGPLGDRLSRIANSVVDSLHTVPISCITPSEWKSHPIAKTPLPSVSTIHERDAIRLGLVYLRTRLQGNS